MTSRSASEPLKYKLRIKDSAEKEWLKLPIPIRDSFKKKLAERLINPRVEKDKLSGMKDCYKIKHQGCRLPTRLQGGRRAIDY
jgi:mRNA interferase RelE/StbE